MNGFQVWVNLPRQDKLMKPRYQEIPAAKIPTAEKDGVKVRVVAGESLGARAVIETRTPIVYLHFTLQPGARVEQPVPAEFNALVYVISGRGLTGDEKIAEGQMVLYAHQDGAVSLSVPFKEKSAMEVLLLAGQPLNEPVARYGPFVMNTEEEIVQAFEDFRAGRLGTIPA
jgi:hypothetical protein